LRNISKQSYSKEFSSLNQRFQVVRLAGRAGRATSRLIAIRTMTRTINRVLFYQTTLKKAISFLGKRYFILKYKYFVCWFIRQPWVILVSTQLFCAYPSVILVSTQVFHFYMRYFVLPPGVHLHFFSYREKLAIWMHVFRFLSWSGPSPKSDD
jgi:hypothetical protein